MKKLLMKTTIGLMKTTFYSIPLTILTLIVSMILKCNYEYMFYYIALTNVILCLSFGVLYDKIKHNMWIEKI